MIYLSYYYTNKYNENNQFLNSFFFKNEGSPLLSQNEISSRYFFIILEMTINSNMKDELYRQVAEEKHGFTKIQKSLC